MSTPTQTPQANPAPAQQPPAKQTDIRTLLQSDKVKQQLAIVLPKHLTPDRMTRVALTCVLRTPQLAACRPESLLQSLMLLSQIGLEPDGRHAHLVPYKGIVTAIVDYRGYIALARRNGLSRIATGVVREGDTFAWRRDSSGLHFSHEVQCADRGDVLAAYCVWDDGGECDGELMSREEIERIRQRSQAAKDGPWVTDWDEMAKKTVVRRASKRWPIDATISAAVDVIERGQRQAALGTMIDIPPEVRVEPGDATDEK